MSRSERQSFSKQEPASADGERSGGSGRARRHFLITAATATGLAGAGLAAWPFLDYLRPSAKARGLGGPVTLDVSRIEPTAQVTVTWRGRPVWVLHRTPDMLERLGHEHWLRKLRDPDSRVASQQPAYARNPYRALRPEYFVCVAVCTHLGCVPVYRPEPGSEGLGEDWMGGYYCPCHGSRFDLAGRVFKGVPAPTNLVVPPHRYLDENILQIGVDHAVS